MYLLLCLFSVELGSKLVTHVLVGTPKEMISFKMMRLFNIEKVTMCVFDDADTVVTTQLVKDHIIHAADNACRFMLMHSGRTSTKFDFMSPYEIHTSVCEPNVEHFVVDCPSYIEKLKMALLMSQELSRSNLQGLIFVEVCLVFCYLNVLIAKNTYKTLLAM